MQQNVRQSGDQSNNKDQNVINFPLAPPHGPPSAGNAFIPGLYGAINPNQYDTPGQLFVPEAPAVHSSDPEVFNNSHGTGSLCLPPADNTPDLSNGQGAFPLDFGQEALNFQGSFPSNSGQAGPSGHGLPVLDADQSGLNDHNPRVVNLNLGVKNSQGPVVTNPYQADLEGKGPRALSSQQTSPNSQGFSPANSDQDRPSIQDLNHQSFFSSRSNPRS